MASKIYLVTLVIVLLMDVYVLAKRKAQGKIMYEFNYSGDYKPCDDQGKNVFNYTNIVINADSPTTTTMGGSFTLNQPLEIGSKLFYDVYKLTETGKQPAWTLEILDICNHVGQENMPWSIVIDAMKLERRSCPIPARKYPFDNLKLDMSAVASTLNKDSVGEYEVKVQLKRLDGFPPRETILACFICGYKIDEVREQTE